MTAHTLFRGFSMTKSITAVAALILADEGELRLSDPVSKYIPSFGDCVVVRRKYADDPHVCPSDTRKVEPLKRKITITDLMLHTSGLSYGPMRSGPNVNTPVIARTTDEKVYR